MYWFVSFRLRRFKKKKKKSVLNSYTGQGVDLGYSFSGPGVRGRARPSVEAYENVQRLNGLFCINLIPFLRFTDKDFIFEIFKMHDVIKRFLEINNFGHVAHKFEDMSHTVFLGLPEAALKAMGLGDDFIDNHKSYVALTCIKHILPTAIKLEVRRQGLMRQNVFAEPHREPVRQNASAEPPELNFQSTDSGVYYTPAPTVDNTDEIVEKDFHHHLGVNCCGGKHGAREGSRTKQHRD